MLSSLPPELLHQIIESTVPHSFHTTTYDDRQRTLSSLSLVSKRFRAIAQPLLYEVVWISALRTIQRFESAREGAGTDGRASLGRNRVKEVAIGDSMKDEDASLDVDEDEVCNFLSTLSSLESLSWKSNERVFLSGSHLPSLQSKPFQSRWLDVRAHPSSFFAKTSLIYISRSIRGLRTRSIFLCSATLDLSPSLRSDRLSWRHYSIQQSFPTCKTSR